MAKIIIIYSTTDGHTKKICQELQQVIEAQNHLVVLKSINDEPEHALNSFDKIVIGASIRYGKHRPEVFKFIKTNISVLESKPNAFFTVNVVARKPEKNLPATNPYLIKFLEKTPWKPMKLAVFAGKINYQKYQILDRLMIRFIMWITKGPTHPDTNVEFTDWSQVDHFGNVICEM